MSDLVDDDWEPCEDEWKPPTEAEMKVLQAKRERSDKISKLMGDYLLKGYRMLGSTCGKCETILLQTKHGENYCVACSELDSDTDKDDPALNNEAARRQAAEQHEREDSGSPSEPVANVSAFVSANVPENRNKQPRVPYQFPLIHRPCPESLHVSNYDSEEQQFHSVSDLPPTGTGLGGANGIRSSLEIVQEKLSWATCELKNSKSVDYSIQLCQLIKSCADTIASLKCLTVEKVASI